MLPVRSIVISACLGGCALLAGGCKDTVTDKDIQTVTMAEVRKLTERDTSGSVALIDPRSPADFAAGHITGARNVPMASVTGEKEQLDPALAEKSYLIVYGNDPGSGVARGMAKRLIRAKHKGVRWYAGGLREWVRNGGPAEKAPVAPAPAPQTDEAPAGAAR